MRLGYSVTSKLVGFGVIAMIIWAICIPFYGNVIDSIFDKLMMGVGAVGIGSIITGVHFQNKERLTEMCRHCPHNKHED